MTIRGFGGTCVVILAFILGMVAQQPAAAPAGAQSTAAASASTQPPADPGSKVVLKVAGVEVTQSELEAIVTRLDAKAQTVVKVEGMRPVGDEYAKMVVLSQRALAEHLDAEPDIRRELEIQRAETLAQAEYQRMARQVQVSDEEVSQYFSAHQADFESVWMQEFIVRKQGPGPKTSVSGLPPAEARKTSEAIRKALLAGKSVEQVKERYVEWNAVLLTDPKPKAFRRAQLAPWLAQAVFAVRPPGLADMLETTEAYYIVKVFSHDHPALKDVAAEIKAKLHQEKLDAEVEAMKKQGGLWMDESFFKPGPGPTRPVVRSASPKQEAERK